MYKFFSAMLWTLLLSTASYAVTGPNEVTSEIDGLTQVSSGSELKDINRDNTCTKSDLRSPPGKQQRLQQLLLQHTLATGMPLLAPGDELTQSINNIAAAILEQQRCITS